MDIDVAVVTITVVYSTDYADIEALKRQVETILESEEGLIRIEIETSEKNIKL